MTFQEYWSELIKAGLRTPTTLETLRTKQASGATQSESHSLKAEEIDSIRRLQSRGFRVIDLDPNLLDRAEFNTPYSSDILAQITGENLTTDNIDGSGTAKCPNPYWRTFIFDAPGNSIKIEFLPVRQELGRGITTTSLEQPIDLVPQGTIYTANPSFIGEASRRVVLLDFEAPTASPHVVTDGMVFKSYFSTFLLTVKNLNTRIRITIGYNSEIISQDDKESSLSLFGARGITTKHQLAPTAFCITHADVNPISSYGVDIPPGGPITRNLLVLNTDVSSMPGTPIGGSVLWITSFSATLLCPATAAPLDGLVRCEIMLYEVDLVYNPITALKRLCSIQLKLPSGTRAGDAVGLKLGEPIRVSLPPMTGLFLKNTTSLQIDGVSTTFVQFALSGYVLGGFAAAEYSGYAVAPFQTTDFLKENPWPMDYAFDGIPQR